MSETGPAGRTAPLAENVRRLMRELGPQVETMASAYTSLSQSDKDLSATVADLTRRQAESESRAQEAERVADDAKEKAERFEKLEKSVVRLVEALNDLPEKMEDGHLVPGATRPDVPLYGTYEWRAVIDSKFFVEEALKEKRVL